MPDASDAPSLTTLQAQLATLHARLSALSSTIALDLRGTLQDLRLLQEDLARRLAANDRAIDLILECLATPGNPLVSPGQRLRLGDELRWRERHPDRQDVPPQT